MAGHQVQAVDAFGQLLARMLVAAERVKEKTAVEQPLNKSDLDSLFGEVDAMFASISAPDIKKRSQYAIIETAVFDAFNDLLATTAIDTPSFNKIWNLLDIISILSDDEQCDPALLFWLIEGLLDSQTIAGCRRIFDYLESRRERITAKHFSQKNLIILRSCNELLRRLSRAEDTAFCGRVFIFMFQSFPLGDKSSVNLRGEYHVENVTTFDKPPEKLDTEKMVDDVTNNDTNSSIKSGEERNGPSKLVTFSNPDASKDFDKLYPTFWSLQESFSQPKKLFDKQRLANFRGGLEATMDVFVSVQNESNGRPTRIVDENKRGIKRKRGSGDDDLANSFNPKYLTSRDLFELEISDLSFRRHILVQVLVLMDFLLSLSTKAKEKLSKATLPDNPNKSVIYADQTFSEEDTKWAIEMKETIAEYLKQGHEGPYFYRMVETVLSRDKNWVRWKIENCPSISKPPITPEEYIAAKASARKATTNKRLRTQPLGSLDLKFLTEDEGKGGLERLKDPSRYQIPPIKSFKSRMELDDMDIDMARDEESKNAAIEAKASKSWRALRIATVTKLVTFDKIERYDKIDSIFIDEIKPEEPTGNAEEESADSDDTTFPKDRRPIVISGPSGVGKGTLIKLLIEKHPKVFSKKISHTTRTPREGEVHGQHYFFVGQADFDILRDGDEFLEYNNFNGNDYGTSQKVVESIIASGKIPVMEMELNGIRQLRERGFQARFLFLAPPDLSELERRLRERGTDSEEHLQQRLDIAKKELEESEVEGTYDKILVNGHLEQSYNNLENYIFSESGSSGEQPTDELTMKMSLESDGGFPTGTFKDEDLESADMTSSQVEREATGTITTNGDAMETEPAL
ncbi:THO complex subunit 1 transcription elongation factor-domain-containing protein [Xylogone sp. PMI_703]|nr:THO complex subunit 1 transcription elongation factor-domain-containing protein [Xylogone sp. PMI_703]